MKIESQKPMLCLFQVKGEARSKVPDVVAEKQAVHENLRKHFHRQPSRPLLMHTSHLVHSQKAAVQVINIRTLKPLDRETIVNSVKKTHR